MHTDVHTPAGRYAWISCMLQLDYKILQNYASVLASKNPGEACMDHYGTFISLGPNKPLTW